MIILEEYNNVVFVICYIDETNDSKYKNNFLSCIICIYRVFLIIKSSLKEVILKKLYKLLKKISYITNIENTI